MATTNTTTDMTARETLKAELTALRARNAELKAELATAHDDMLRALAAVTAAELVR